MLYEKRKRYIRTFKTLRPNLENVISELRKRHTRTSKTLYPNFENITSELQLWKRYIRILKRYLRTKIRVDFSAKKLNKWTKK